VSSNNPHGDITNSDFEQAAMVVQLDNIANSYDVRGATISNLTDNTPTLTRHFKGSTTTSGPAAYLCQISSLHQRYRRYCSKVSFINGVENVMADDASHLQHLTDSEFLHHFNSVYPQETPWTLCQSQPEMIDLSPPQVFTGTSVDVNHWHWNPIFCPAYVLTGPLQTTGIQDKWRERSTPGIYLGRSPLPARSVAPVLNLKTGRVSPQFHVALDPTFSTVSGRDGTLPPVSL